MKHIREYIADIEFEGKEIEFKLRFSDKDDESWCKTIVAFANTIGGSMFLGVDNDGFVQGFKKPTWISWFLNLIKCVMIGLNHITHINIIGFLMNKVDLMFL